MVDVYPQDRGGPADTDCRGGMAGLPAWQRRLRTPAAGLDRRRRRARAGGGRAGFLSAPWRRRAGALGCSLSGVGFPEWYSE
ncbi:hypothetical protein G6F50_017609 [Rhizopus delemar]|uniref:Uncharacterized protein n=1 Tax=Rhizopus delemar TaxID=936053 RepID=A0A9P6XPJ8_9FUNG|nr:hypothetical protein G6F50_017609 [Rhizopus delemar]